MSIPPSYWDFINQIHGTGYYSTGAKRADGTITILIQRRCSKCGKDILKKGKRPIADVQTGEAFCDFLCWGLKKEQKNVHDL